MSTEILSHMNVFCIVLCFVYVRLILNNYKIDKIKCFITKQIKFIVFNIVKIQMWLLQVDSLA